MADLDFRKLICLLLDVTKKCLLIQMFLVKTTSIQGHFETFVGKDIRLTRIHEERNRPFTLQNEKFFLDFVEIIHTVNFVFRSPETLNIDNNAIPKLKI